jgi:hypothetical protein
LHFAPSQQSLFLSHFLPTFLHLPASVGWGNALPLASAPASRTSALRRDRSDWIRRAKTSSQWAAMFKSLSAPEAPSSPERKVRQAPDRALHRVASKPVAAGSCGCADVVRAPSRNRGGRGQGERRSDSPTGHRRQVVGNAALARAWHQPTIRASARRRRAVRVRSCLGPSRSSPLLTGGRILCHPRLPGPAPALPRPCDRPALIPDCPRNLATTMKITRKTRHSFRPPGGDGVIRSNGINQDLS